MAALTIPASTVRSSRTPSAPVRLTRRGRRLARTVVVGLLLVVALVALTAGRVPAVSAGDGPAVSATRTVVVQPGETLWQVAQAVAPGVDPRATIDRIKDLNSMSGAAADQVRPGQQLVVPAAGADVRVTTDELGVVAFVLPAYPQATFEVEEQWEGGYALRLITPEELEEERLEAQRPHVPTEAEARLDADLERITAEFARFRRTA